VSYPPARSPAWDGAELVSDQPRPAIVPPAQRPRIEGVTVGADQIMRERRARAADEAGPAPPPGANGGTDVV
jgi:hypothetical protein